MTNSSGIGSGNPVDMAWLAWLSKVNPAIRGNPNRQLRLAFDAGYHARDAEVSALKRQIEAERNGHGF